MRSSEFVALGFDPAPGDTHEIESQAACFAAAVRWLTEAEAALSPISRVDHVWNGAAAAQFTQTIAETLPLLRCATDAMGRAAHALNHWAVRLAELQTRARQLEADARNAHARDAPDDLDHLRWLARQLQDSHTTEANYVARLLDSAASLAPTPAGVFERIGTQFGRILELLLAAGEFAWDFVQENADTIAYISDIASDLSTGLGAASGVLALFPGAQPVAGVLGAGAAALSVAAFVGHSVAKAAGHDVGWETIALDAAGVVPVGKLVAKGVAHLSDAPEVFAKQVGGATTVEQHYLLSLTGNLLAEHWNPRSPQEAALALISPTDYAAQRITEAVRGG